MKETLICSICKNNWKRELTRGRKPTVCPKCVKLAQKEAAKVKKTAQPKVFVPVAKRKIKAVEGIGNFFLSSETIFCFCIMSGGI